MNQSPRDNDSQLHRGLTLAPTISLVVGAVIGTGVFLKATVMAQTVGSPSLVLLAAFLAAILPINYVWAEYPYQAFGQSLVWRFGTQQALALGVIILLSAL